MSARYYKLVDKKLVPCKDVIEWAEWFEGDGKIVASTLIDGEPRVQVSTVCLGFDHGFGGRPLYFETMIFGGKHDHYCERYSTYEEAEQGHADIVAALKAGIAPGDIS